VWPRPACAALQPVAEFGTRSQTVVAVSRGGCAQLRERHRDAAAGGEWRDHAVAFDMSVAPAGGGAAGAQAEVRSDKTEL